MPFLVFGEPAEPVQLAERLALAAFPVQRADGGNAHKHENSGEQDDDDQGYLLVLPKRQQLDRQGLTSLLISDLGFE